MNKKRWLSVILAAVMILNIVLPAKVFAESEEDTVNEITMYVSATGKDDTGNGTQANPYATIAKAEEVIEADSAATGKIIITGEVQFSAASHTKMITITGDGNSNTYLIIGGGRQTNIAGPTIMENIQLYPKDGSNNSGDLQTNQAELVLGQGVVMHRFNGYFRVGALDAEAGDSNGTGSIPTLTIHELNHDNGAYSGNYIRVGTGHGKWMNGANITIHGGKVEDINFHRATQFSQNVNLVINGGTIGIIQKQTHASFSGAYQFKKAFQIVFNNGTRDRVTTFDKASLETIPCNDGRWYMYGQEGGSLSTTEIAGTFKVNGNKYAKATLKSDANTVYYGNPGETLTVPAGEYDVTYSSKNPAGGLTQVTAYVSASGNDTTGDGTNTNPYATISKAEQMIEADADADLGKIIISGSVEFSAAAHTKMMTITGDGEAATKLVLNKFVRIAGPTTIEFVTLHNGSDGQVLPTEGQKLIFGQGVNVTYDTYKVMTLLVGDGWRGVGSGRPTIEINSMSGLAPVVQVGAVSISSAVELPGADVVLNGGTLHQINLCPTGKGITYTDDVNVTVNGGTPGLIQVSQPATFKKALQVVLNNGVSASVINANVDTNATVEGGKWIMCGDATGGLISTTGTAGTFKVNGEKYAKAILKSDSNKVYYGNPGETLTVPAGEYDVTYLDRNPDGTLNEVTVYVSATGNDDTGDGTQVSPYATIAKAEEVLEANKAADIGKIIISGSVVFGSAKHTKMITVTGDGGEDTKLRLETFVRLNGPTTIEHLTMYKMADAEHFITGGDKLVIGKEVKVTRKSDLDSIIRIAVGDYYTTKDSVGSSPGLEVNSISGAAVIVESGCVQPTQKPYYVSGANIVINDGNLNQINLAPADGIVYTDDVNVTINGGTLANGVWSSKTATFKGAFQFLVNDGSGNLNVRQDLKDKVVAEGGVWYMYDDVNEGLGYIPDESKLYAGCKLATTEIAGSFDVVNESGLETVYAVATNLENPSIVYYSSAATKDDNGALSVPTGEWVVTYVTEMPDWYCTGSQVVFNKTVDNFDLAAIAIVEYEDQIIIGWKNGDELAVNGVFEAGTRLNAVYAACTKKTNFSVADTEIRLDDGALRFKINMGMNFYNELNVSEYGVIAIKSANVAYKDCGDIKIGNSYNGREPEVIKAQNIYSIVDNKMTYTLCLKDIADTAEAYYTDYMVRGYVKFIDQNGNNRVVYTDFEQSSVKAAVEKMLSDDAVSESIKNTLNEKYMSVIDAERTRLATLYQGTEVTIDDGISAPFKVKEVTVNKRSGSTSDKLTLVQLSDMHINHLSEKDFVDNRQTVLSFYRNRKYGKDAAFAKVAERALKYADAVADQVIVTGDTLDNLNEGTLDIQKRLLWSRYPNIISTTGNHDWMEATVSSITEVLTKREAQERLQEDAAHDVLYSSKVMKDVMLIQMDNAALNEGRGYGYGYEQSQIDKLTADLAIARDKNYTVLIFQHVTLPTDDDDPRFKEIRTPESTPANDKASGQCNKEMIQLIKNNSDIIKAIFCGHEHATADTFVGGIPQYVANATHYSGGYAVKITVQ